MLLHSLVREVHVIIGEVACRKVDCREPCVKLLKPKNFIGLSHQDPHPNVKLPTVDQQGRLDVLLNHEMRLFGQTSVMAHFGNLISAVFEAADHIDALTSIQRHSLEDPHIFASEVARRYQ